MLKIYKWTVLNLNVNIFSIYLLNLYDLKIIIITVFPIKP